MDAVDAASLRAWTPVRVRASGPAPVVDWAVAGTAFTDSFFEQTAGYAMNHPFNLVFGRRTPLAVLDDPALGDGGLAPAGFVFHLSRSGSTLIAQILAQLSDAIVLSEAQPLDALLRMRAGAPGHGDDERLAVRLRALVRALGRPHRGERRLFVKLHAWHVLELPFIARAFPGVPWAFVFREPRAVLRSQARSPGAEAVAGDLDPRYLGLDHAAAYGLEPAEYRARVLAALCESALRHAHLGRARFVEYAALPEAALSELPAFFGAVPTLEEEGRMRAAAARDAKGPAAAFRAPPSEAPDPGIDELAARWLDGPYAALRAAAAISS